MTTLRSLFSLLLAASLGAQTAVESRLQKDVAWLADPARKGRGSGDPSLEEAATFLLRRYKALGLKATVQRFPFLARVGRLEADAALGVGDQISEKLVWGRDVEALGSSGDGHFQTKALTFVGYGLQSPMHDDGQSLDLKGRVVLLLRGVPGKPPFDHIAASERSISSRIRKAIQAGAAAVVVLEEGEQALPLRLEEGMGLFKIPVLSMPLRVPARVCKDLVERVKALKETEQPQSKDYVFAPWSFLNLRLVLKREEVQLPNVVATLPGRAASKRSEHVVLGAHFDHLGLGDRHSLGGAAAKGLVHHGADDNASGTALVLELARRLKAHPPRRSVTFLHFAGEEEGLLGSAHWIRTPTIPLPSVKAMLNFDMVGRMDAANPTLLLGGLGMPIAGLDSLKTHLPKGLSLGKDLGAAIGASDHLSFAMAKIPTLFFFTGLHGDYHRPTDTADRINTKGMAQIAQFAFQVTRNLGEIDAPPPFDPATAVLPTQSARVSSKVRFGTLPDYQPHPDGFRISGVSPGSTAELLGLKAGDVLTFFGPKELHSIQDFMEALNAHQPGDKVVVKWLRSGKAMEAETVLRGRE